MPRRHGGLDAIMRGVGPADYRGAEILVEDGHAPSDEPPLPAPLAPVSARPAQRASRCRRRGRSGQAPPRRARGLWLGGAPTGGAPTGPPAGTRSSETETVGSRKEFRNGTGFFATLCDGDTPEDRITAFFFREAARAHGDSVRPGTRLCMRVRPDGPNRTYVKKANAAFGGGWQLVVGTDAVVAPPEPYMLSTMPAQGAVEVHAVVVETFGEEFATNGNVYRKITIADASAPRGMCWSRGPPCSPSANEDGCREGSKRTSTLDAL